MNDVISIYEAKTHLSKLVKRASAGEVIYIGAYGQPQATLTPLPAKQKINIGVWAHKRDPNFNSDSLVGSDQDIIDMFEESVNKSLS